MARDTQRERLYRAESEAVREWTNAGNSIHLPRKHSTPLQDAQWFVRGVSDWSEFKSWTPRIQQKVDAYPQTVRGRIVVQVKREGSYISTGGGEWVRVKARGTEHLRPRIHMAPAALTNKKVLLHECAHWVGSWDDLGHGPVFAAAMIELTKRFIGPEFAELLRDCHVKHGVDAYWN